MTNQEAIEVLKLNNPFMAGKDKETFSKAIDKGIEALESQKTGHWIELNVNKDGTHNIYCSNCNKCQKFKGHANSYNARTKLKYCFNCGVKMEGDR